MILNILYTSSEWFISLFLILQCSFNESLEQWMRSVWSGFQLRMRLSCDKPWMRRDLNHLYNTAVRWKSAKRHSVFFKNFTVVIVYFITMTMTFFNLFLSIQFISKRVVFSAHMDKNQVLKYHQYLQYQSDSDMMWMTGCVVVRIELHAVCYSL